MGGGGGGGGGGGRGGGGGGVRWDFPQSNGYLVLSYKYGIVKNVTDHIYHHGLYWKKLAEIPLHFRHGYVTVSTYNCDI